jgi:hypothetical protein
MEWIIRILGLSSFGVMKKRRGSGIGPRPVTPDHAERTECHMDQAAPAMTNASKDAHYSKDAH